MDSGSAVNIGRIFAGEQGCTHGFFRRYQADGSLIIDVNHLPDVAEVVGPETKGGGQLDGLSLFFEQWMGEEMRAVGDKDVVGLKNSVRVVVLVVYQTRLKTGVLGGCLDDRCEIQIAVRDMHSQDPVGLQVFPIEAKRLRCEEMNRNGIAGEGIDHKDVEALRNLLFERKASVTERDIDVGG